MRQEIEHKKARWINLFKPDYKELWALHEEFGFEPLDVEESQNFTQRPKLEQRPEYVFLVLHVPLFEQEKRVTVPGEIDIFVTKNALITVEHEEIPVLKYLLLKAQDDDNWRGQTFSRGIPFLLYVLVDALFDDCLPKLDRILEKIEVVEHEIFAGRERQMVQEISLIQRDLTDFRRIMRAQKNLFGEALPHFPGFGMRERLYFRSIAHKLARIWDILENLNEMLRSLALANESLLSYKLNELMKVLNIFLVITVPLWIVASSVQPKGLGEMPGARILYWFILIFMVAFIATVIFYFRRKRLF
jgi:magnesium transporter